MTWVLLGEILPNRIRAIGLAVAAVAQWIATFAVSYSFPSLAEFSLVCACSLYTGFVVL